MKYTTLLLAALGAAAMAFTGCNSNDDPDDPQAKSYIDIMTIAEKNGDGTVLTFQKENDSPLITLTTNQTFSQSVFTVGKRVVVNYVPQSGVQYESGNISILQAMLTEGEGAKPEAKTATETSGWSTDGISMYTAWRTGPYLNVIFNGVTSSAGPEECAIYADAATVGTAQPTVYLIFEGSNGNMVSPYFFYASYDISELWDNPATESLRLVYAESQTGTRSVDFPKVNSGDVPVVRP